MMTHAGRSTTIARGCSQVSRDRRSSCVPNWCGFALILDRGGMRRVWLRGRENIQKRYLVHVAGYNLGLIMRLLTGAGTPREFRVQACAWLFATFESDGALILRIFVAIDDQFAVLGVTIRPNSGW